MAYEIEKIEYKGYSITIEGEDEAFHHPRRDQDNLGTLIWWHKHYTSPDENEFSDYEELLEHLAGVSFDDLEQRNWEDVYKLKGRWRSERFVKEYIHKKAHENAVILPVYMYDHSGITINTDGFSCPWDSGQVGVIFCTRERFLKETGYNKQTLFSTDSKRKPKKGDYVRWRGFDRDWGRVLKAGRVHLVVDFDPHRSGEHKDQTKTVTLNYHHVSQVLSNRAEAILRSEVRVFDDYLTGNVACYVIRNGEGEVVASVYGFCPDHGDDFDTGEGTVHLRTGRNEWQYVIDEAKLWIDADIKWMAEAVELPLFPRD